MTNFVDNMFDAANRAAAVYSRMSDEGSFRAISIGSSGYPVYEEFVPSNGNPGFTQATALGFMPLTDKGYQFLINHLELGALFKAKSELDKLIAEAQIKVDSRFELYGEFSGNSLINIDEFPLKELYQTIDSQRDIATPMSPLMVTISAEGNMLRLWSKYVIYQAWAIANKNKGCSPKEITLNPITRTETVDLNSMFNTKLILPDIKSAGFITKGKDYIDIPLGSVSTDFAQGVQRLHQQVYAALTRRCSKIQELVSWLISEDVLPGNTGCDVAGPMLTIHLQGGDLRVVQDEVDLLHMDWPNGHLHVATVEELMPFIKVILAMQSSES